MAVFENIKLEKGMYGVKGKSLTAVLEELDPSENYKGTALEGLDAYQRQLKRFDIKVSGSGSDPVWKFFETTNSAALFPEYVTRAVRTGMEQENILNDIIAAKTVIDSMDYRSIVSCPTNEEKSLKIVMEGTALPQTVVRTQENLVHLHKRGRMLVASYEALKFQRLDLFTVTLRQIGAYIAKTQAEDAMNVLLNGDGNNNAAAEITAESGLNYDSLIQLWAELSPYKLNTIAAPTDAMQKILGMQEMRDAVAGLNFQSTGKPVTPLGAKLIHVPSLTSGQIIGLDKNYALEMVQAGDVIVDYDKLIDRQLERAAISSIAGFAKIFADSAKVMTY
ncbi:MAG: phage major capsid protein [Acutalibacteraceae bacterium]